MEAEHRRLLRIYHIYNLLIRINVYFRRVQITEKFIHSSFGLVSLARDVSLKLNFKIRRNDFFLRIFPRLIKYSQSFLNLIKRNFPILSYRWRMIFRIRCCRKFITIKIDRGKTGSQPDIEFGIVSR